MKKSIKNIILDTLEKVNEAIKSDPNSLVLTSDGYTDPEKAYIDLVRELLALNKE